MRLRIRKPITTLDARLDAATRGLCADAKERVAEEVTAHFEDARTAGMAR